MNDIFPNSTHIKQLLHLADDTDIASFLEKIWDGETISIVVGIKADEEEALKQGLRELSLLGERGKNAYSDSAEKCSNVSENFLIVGAINRSRYGKFPFFRDEVPAPTPMDDLALDAGVLDFVSKAFTSYKDEDGILSDSSHKKHTTASHPVYPKLVDARLVNLFDKESSHTIEIEYRDYWNLISTSSKTGNASRQLILVTIPLSFTDRIKSSNINVTFFDPSKTVQVQTHQNHQSIKPALKILFRHPDTQYLESGDMAIIRYLEHAQPWIASLNLMQRSAIGFPPPWHSYWQDVDSFKQVERRFRNCGMDFGPYRIDQAVTKVHTPLQPIPQHPHMSKEYHPDKTYLEPCRLVDPEQVSLLYGIPSLTDDQIRQFRDDGYLFLDGIFPSEVIDSAVDAAEMLWPDEGHLGDRKLSIRDFSFPFRDNRLNTLTTHDNLLTVIKQLLGVEMTNDIRIMQSICVPKRGTSVDTKVIEDCDNTCEPMTPGNQKMHWDFGNNTLLVPSRTPSNWSQVEEIQVRK